MFKRLAFPGTAIDLAYPFQFNFGTFNVAHPCTLKYSWPDSWPKSGLRGKRGASPQCQVHNLDLKTAPPAPQQTEQQPEMGYLPRIILLTSCSSAHRDRFWGEGIIRVHSLLSSWPRLQKCQ